MRSIEEIKTDIEKCGMCDWPDCTPDGAKDGNRFGTCFNCEAIYKGNKQDLLKELKEAVTDGIPLDRLEEICNAECEGRLMELPCDFGSDIYVVIKEWDGRDCIKTSFRPHVRLGKVASFYIAKNRKIVVYANFDCCGGYSDYIPWSDIFLTLEAALKAIKNFK